MIKFVGEKIIHNNRVDIIPSLSPAWYVSSEINPYSGGDWLSVVLFARNNHPSHPVPEVVMHYSRLYIYNLVNGRRNTFVSNPLTFNKYTRVEISQKPDVNNELVILYTIKINGKQVYQTVCHDARYSENIYVYKGSLWRNPAEALIKDFVYENLMCGRCFFVIILSK